MKETQDAQKHLGSTFLTSPEKTRQYDSIFIIINLRWHRGFQKFEPIRSHQAKPEFVSRLETTLKKAVQTVGKGAASRRKQP